MNFYMTLFTQKLIFLYVKEVLASLMINFPHTTRAKQARPHLILSDIYYYSPSCWQSCNSSHDANVNCCKSHNNICRVLGLWFHWNYSFSIIFAKRLRWSTGSVLAFGTQVRGFKPVEAKNSSARLASEGK